MPQHARRKTDFSKGIKLGVNDHVAAWEKPKQKPDWMDEDTYARLPTLLEMREFKSRGKVLVTTLLNPKKYSRKDVAKLYSARWTIEVDLRFIKKSLGMEVLRCKTPEMIRKEIASYLLGYNLIRLLMVQAAHHRGVPLRNISFTGTLQALNVFREKFLHAAKGMLMPLYELFLAAILAKKVGNRPGRIEPRVLKRRKSKKYPYMNKPRQQMREALANSVPA